MTVASPCKGKIEKFTVQLNESYAVGATLGQIEATNEEAARLGLDVAPEKTSDTHHTSKSDANGRDRSRVQPTIRGLPVPANAAGASYLSPRLKARMDELGLHAADLAGVAGSGAAGRVTVEDFEKYITSLEKHKMSAASSMRVAVADAMRRSWTRPLATVGLPVPLDAVLAHRKSSNPKPGPALYALRALAIALAENSAVAGRLVGNKIIHPSAIDVGFAVEAADGVLVPVLRGADKKDLKELVVRYDELVELARQRKLPADATGGSVATVTNFGRVRPDLGHADSAAGTDARAGPGRGPADAALGRGEGTIRAGDGGVSHLELRPPRARRRRGGPAAPAHRRADEKTGVVVTFKNKTVWKISENILNGTRRRKFPISPSTALLSLKRLPLLPIPGGSFCPLPATVRPNRAGIASGRWVMLFLLCGSPGGVAGFASSVRVT